jgi:hypothetical protein
MSTNTNMNINTNTSTSMSTNMNTSKHEHEEIKKQRGSLQNKTGRRERNKWKEDGQGLVDKMDSEN